jgi:hypothetical protein
MIKLKNILEENYSHIRYLVSDLKNLYYEVDDAKLKNIIIDLIPNGSYYQYTPNKADFYIKKFDELEKLSKRVLKSNNPALKTIQKIVKGGLEFWNQKESVNESNLYNYYNRAEPSVKNAAKKVDVVLQKLIKDKNELNKLVELITDLADEYAEERIDNWEAEKNI